jgi:uncharacterized membrane protein YeaQ/YmgE (transglycosylase-associated protein family)
MSLIFFILIGFFAGLIARAVVSGPHPMGLVATTLLGMVGSLLGGMIGSLFTPGESVFHLQRSGILMSVVGAIIVLFIYSRVQRRQLSH